MTAPLATTPGPVPTSPGLYPGVPVAYPGYPDPNTTSQPPPPVSPPPPATLGPPTRAHWTFAIGPATGGLDRVLSAPRSRKVTFKLNANAEASCEIDGRDPAATYVVELATDLHVFRSPGPGQPSERLFRGRIGKTSDDLDGSTHTVQLPALDYRAVLARRRLMTGSQITWTDADLSTIAMGLIGQAQNKTGGNYGITSRAPATGITATRTFKLGDPITDKIQELSEQESGFDWDITSVDDYALALDVWPGQRGTDRGVILQWGPGGPIAKLNRQVDSSAFSNAVRLNGRAPDGSQAEPAIQERYASNLGSAPEGRWDSVYGETITTTDALAARADWRLGDAQVVRPTYSVTLRQGFWRGPSHIFLGDPVRLVVFSGRLRIDTTLRVQELSVSVSDNGQETVVVKLGPARTDYLTRAMDTERRLLDLERM